VEDLFPKIDLPPPSYIEFSNGISSICGRENLVMEESFRNKVIQLFETMQVRFGSMIVGSSTVGKSKIVKTHLRNEKSEDPRF
jgi:dynein heavy chain, axonemal